MYKACVVTHNAASWEGQQMIKVRAMQTGEAEALGQMMWERDVGTGVMGVVKGRSGDRALWGAWAWGAWGALTRGRWGGSNGKRAVATRL